MKKIISFMLALAVCALTLCSCGGAKIDETHGVYRIEKNIYYYSLVDSAYNADDGYTVKESNGKTMLFRTHVGISGENTEEAIGVLKAFALKKSNFDKLVYGNYWQNGDNAESIRKANNGAWKAEKESGEIFYLLLQDDGTLLLACIKNKEG